MAESSDCCLGMGQPIPRRDFLNGMAAAIGAGFVSGCSGGVEDQGPENTPGYYPPALTGLRGSTDAAYEHAHAVRDSSFWERAGSPIPTGETYDLAVIGAGPCLLVWCRVSRSNVEPPLSYLRRRRGRFHQSGDDMSTDRVHLRAGASGKGAIRQTSIGSWTAAQADENRISVSPSLSLVRRGWIRLTTAMPIGYRSADYRAPRCVRQTAKHHRLRR